MNNIYLYQESFNELLKLINYLIKNNITPFDIQNINNYHENLIYQGIYLNSLKDTFKMSNKINKIVFQVFLSNNKNKELVIYYFLKNYLKYGENIIYYRNLKCVNLALAFSKKVARENHRFKGFTRFKLTNNNIYFAIINPDNNILPLLARHFKERFKNEYFVIYDENHKFYAFYDKKKVYFLSDKIILKLKVDINQKENDVEDLWKSFFKIIAIKERENLKLERQNMPKKYWKYIIEMENKKNEKNNNW